MTDLSCSPYIAQASDATRCPWSIRWHNGMARLWLTVGGNSVNGEFEDDAAVLHWHKEMRDQWLAERARGRLQIRREETLK